MRKGRGRKQDRLFLTRKRRVGQSSVEYLLLISVLVMAFYWVVIESNTIGEPMRDGMNGMEDGVSTWIDDGVVGGG